MNSPITLSRIIGTAGHIDHGKTSLIKALTGMDTDRLKEEKKRGLSIDLGFASIELEGEGSESMRAAIVDVPGHERFIKNMLAGATGMDLVLFTVAADDGVMPQTVEHLDIIRLLAVKRVIFAVTKCDLASEEKILAVEGEVRGLLKGTRLEGAPMIRVSSLTGIGVDELKKVLFSELRALGPRSEVDGLFRLPVDRSFAVRGFGTVVTGTVASGTVKKGDGLFCFPSATSVKVRGLESMHEAVDSVSAGERVALNLAGMGYKDIKRGFVLTSPEFKAFCGAPPVVDCFFEFLGDEKSQRKKLGRVRDRGLIMVHHQTRDTLARIRLSGIKSAERGAGAFGRLVLKRPLLMLRGDPFILRDPSVNTTVGGGRVFAAYPEKGLIVPFKKIRPPLSGGQDISEVLRLLIPADTPGLDIDTLAPALNIKRDALSALLNKSGFSEDGLAVMDGFVVDNKKVLNIRARAVKILAEFHEAEPQKAGMNEEDMIRRLVPCKPGGEPVKNTLPLYKKILDEMVIKGEVARHESLLRLPAHRAALTGAGAEIERGIKGLFSSGGQAVCRMEEIKKLPFKEDEVMRVVDYLQKEGALVRIKTGTFISGEGVQKARIKLEGHIRAKGSIRAAEFRDILGCGRKLAIELLEYFDRVRVTLRKGDLRTLR